MLPKLREGFDCFAAGLAQARRAEERGRIAVAAPPNFVARWLMPRLRSFTSSYPQFDLRIIGTLKAIDNPEHDSSRDPGRADDEAQVAVRYGMGEYPGAVVDLLFRPSYVPVCSPKLLGRGPPLRKPADLKHHTLIHDDSSPGDEERPGWEEWLAFAGVKGVDATRGPRFSNASLVHEAAIDGVGVALALRPLVDSDIEEGRLVVPIERPAADQLRLLPRHARGAARAPGREHLPALARGAGRKPVAAAGADKTVAVMKRRSDHFARISCAKESDPFSLSSGRNERRLLHRGDLLLQFEHAVLPVALRVEPGERHREGRVGPASRDPRGVVQQAQRAQRFDEPELAVVEVGEILVAAQHVPQLHRHRVAVAGEQHPQVLHRRAGARIVEVDEVRSARGPEHVAGVAVAVQPDARDANRRARRRVRLASMARAAAPDHASSRSGGMNPCSSSQSREAVPNAATSSVGRCTNDFVAPTPWMRPMKRPSHSSV